MSALALQGLDFQSSSSPGVSSDAKKLAGMFVDIKNHRRKTATLNGKYAALDFAYSEAREEGWDGHGAAAADAKSYHLAKEFLSQLPDKFSPPEITIDPDGEISFEWYISKNRLIILSVGGNGALNYIGVVRKNRQKGEEYFTQQIPDTILALFKRILL